LREGYLGVVQQDFLYEGLSEIYRIVIMEYICAISTLALNIESLTVAYKVWEVRLKLAGMSLSKFGEMHLMVLWVNLPVAKVLCVGNHQLCWYKRLH